MKYIGSISMNLHVHAPFFSKTWDVTIHDLRCLHLGEDDYYTYGLFHVPSYTSGSKALLKSEFIDMSHVGCKGNGEEMIFGDEGKVLKAPGSFFFRSNALEPLVFVFFCNLQCTPGVSTCCCGLNT